MAGGDFREVILATNPTTPAERVRAAKILADLQRPPDAVLDSIADLPDWLGLR